MKLNGHTVAMTGDGVNDVLALKEADCSIAIANGSDAAKAVSRLVLLDSNFDSIPNIVYEGRRTINNITRSATLFLSKTGYAILFTLIYLILKVSYPFEPVQISLISSLTIGIPSFVLALEDNKDRVKGDFLKNVLYKSVPVSVTSVVSVLLVEILGLFLNLSQMEKSTIDVFLIEFIGFMLIFKLSIPFNKMRKSLFYFCISCFIICVVFLRDFYSLALLKGELILLTFILMALCIYMLMFFYKKFNKLIDKWEAKK
jgi:cation-transporting ATPase E